MSVEQMTKRRPATAAIAIQAVELLGFPPVKPATIRKWAERGKVRKYGRDQDGLVKYDLGDIVRLARLNEAA